MAVRGAAGARAWQRTIATRALDVWRLSGLPIPKRLKPISGNGEDFGRTRTWSSSIQTYTSHRRIPSPHILQGMKISSPLQTHEPHGWNGGVSDGVLNGMNKLTYPLQVHQNLRTLQTLHPK